MVRPEGLLPFRVDRNARDREVPAVALVALVPAERPLAEVRALGARRASTSRSGRSTRRRTRRGRPRPVTTTRSRSRSRRTGRCTRVTRRARAGSRPKASSSTSSTTCPVAGLAGPAARPRARDRALPDARARPLRAVVSLGLPRRGVRASAPKEALASRAGAHERRSSTRPAAAKCPATASGTSRSRTAWSGLAYKNGLLPGLDRGLPVRRQALPLPRQRRHGQDGRPRAVVVGEDRLRRDRDPSPPHPHRRAEALKNLRRRRWRALS